MNMLISSNSNGCWPCVGRVPFHELSMIKIDALYFLLNFLPEIIHAAQLIDGCFSPCSLFMCSLIFYQSWPLISQQQMPGLAVSSLCQDRFLLEWRPINQSLPCTLCSSPLSSPTPPPSKAAAICFSMIAFVLHMQLRLAPVPCISQALAFFG